MMRGPLKWDIGVRAHGRCKRQQSPRISKKEECWCSPTSTLCFFDVLLDRLLDRLVKLIKPGTLSEDKLISSEMAMVMELFRALFHDDVALQRGESLTCSWWISWLWSTCGPSFYFASLPSSLWRCRAFVPPPPPVGRHSLISLTLKKPKTIWSLKKHVSTGSHSRRTRWCSQHWFQRRSDALSWRRTKC